VASSATTRGKDGPRRTGDTIPAFFAPENDRGPSATSGPQSVQTHSAGTFPLPFSLPTEDHMQKDRTGYLPFMVEVRAIRTRPAACAYAILMHVNKRHGFMQAQLNAYRFAHSSTKKTLLDKATAMWQARKKAHSLSAEWSSNCNMSLRKGLTVLHKKYSPFVAHRLHLYYMQYVTMPAHQLCWSRVHAAHRLDLRQMCG
jgi:hypothetical protein